MCSVAFVVLILQASRRCSVSQIQRRRCVTKRSQTMDQQSLRDLWRTGKAGALCPWQQALAVAFRTASEEIHDGTVNHAWVASRVSKVGGGHPSREAMRTWRCNGAGMAVVVERLESCLRKMLGRDARLPRVLFTDRGTGMYTPAGRIVREYEAAVRRAGFRTFWGADATRQASDLADALLHETAVALFRKHLRKERPVRMPWEETPEEWTERAAKVARNVNGSVNLDSLCKSFPRRLRALVEKQGDRLRK